MNLTDPDPSLASLKCEETTALLQNVWFIMSKLLKMLLSPLTLILHVHLIKALKRCDRSVISINPKYLLVNISVCSLLASGFIFGKSVYTLGIWLFGDACDLIVTNLNCKAQEAIFVFAKLPILIVILALGFERWYATKHLEDYVDNVDQRPIFAIVVIWLAWLFSFFCTGLLTFSNIHNDTVTLTPYCNALFVYDPVAITGFCALFLPLEIIGALIFILLWFCSIRQMDQCPIDPYHSARLRVIALTRFLLASSSLHTVCWTTILAVATFVAAQWSTRPTVGYLVATQYLFYILSLLHMILHPVLCFVLCDSLRQQAIKELPEWAKRRALRLGGSHKPADNKDIVLMQRNDCVKVKKTRLPSCRRVPQIVISDIF